MDPLRTGSIMVKSLVALLVAASVLAPLAASAQIDMGSLRGYVKDEQGGALPGVTVTASGPQIIAPVVGATDDSGYYRLLNLPPGTITLTADLTGFAPYRREGIRMRAGSTFAVECSSSSGQYQAESAIGRYRLRKLTPKEWSCCPRTPSRPWVSLSWSR